MDCIRQFRTLGLFWKLNSDLLSSFHGGNKFTNRERLEYVKEYKASSLSVKEFSESRGISRTTMQDWINAFESFTGDLFTLIRSAMINGLDHQAYLKYCLCHYADTPIENLLSYHRELKEKLPLK